MTTNANQPDALAAIRLGKQQINKDLQASREKMADIIHEIASPMPRPRNKVQGIGQLVSNGMAIYEGLRIGLSIISAIRSLFGKRKRR